MADEQVDADPTGSAPRADPALSVDERAAELTMAALDDQLGYFGRQSATAKKWYQRLRLVTLITAAAIPVAAAADADPMVSAVLGSLVVVFEGTQQVFHFHDRWIDFRGNVNALQREKRLYQARAGAYAEASRPGRLLAENFESIMQADSATWSANASAAAAPDS